MTTISENLKTFMQQELINGQVMLNNDDDLLLSGLIDSLGVVRLIAFIEQTFATHVPPEDVTIENFGTVQSIADYVQSRMTVTH
jgi:acyl carrier protein